MRIMSKFKSPDDLYTYVVETVEILHSSGISQAAKSIEDANSTFYTTGSEWLGELGLAVRAVEAEFDIHDEIQDRLRLIMKAVKETWPKM